MQDSGTIKQMTTADWILAANVFSTLYMVGLIWFVQVVHYPLFAKVGRDNYTDYQFWHQRLTTFVVGPPMLVEAFSSVLLLYYLPAGANMNLLLLGIALVFVIWLSTAFLQVPCHAKLEKQFDERAHHQLMNTNWIRTFAWTARGLMMTYLLMCEVLARGTV